MTDVFSGLAIILGVSAVAGWVAKSFRQPPLLGYVLAGVLMAVTGISHSMGIEGMAEIMGKFGVTLLLFLAGMELPISELKRTGKTALITALVQITLCTALGFGLAMLLGFSNMEAVYIGLGMAFGSTIMVVKILSENGDIQSLHGKIAVGYLLVQDFVAIGLLVVLAGMAQGNITPISLGIMLVKGVVMVVLAVVLAETVMGKIVDYFAKSPELLFVASISWCLLVAAAVASPVVGFSLEIGGFLAGLTLAKASEQAQIISRIRPLRDFFLIWFFVAMGLSVRLGSLSEVWLAALVFSITVILATSGVVYTVLENLGQHKRTAFFTAISVAQISEFSLIIAAWGFQAGEIGERVVLVLTLVALATMTASSYLIANSGRIYRLWGKWLWKGMVKHVKSNHHEDTSQKMIGHAVLFGHSRTGSRVLPVLNKLGWDVLIVDFNPDVIDGLQKLGMRAIYGDVSDHELFEKFNLHQARMIISTVPDIYDNLHLLGGLSKNRKDQIVIVTAADNLDAHSLYRAGADYVLIPNLVGGDYLANIIEHHGDELGKYFAGKKAIEEAGK